MQGERMKYPSKDEKDIAALERLTGTAYAEDDMPFLSTNRYQLSPDYEPSDVTAKARVDTQSAMENAWWMQQWKEST
jgi:hypothetical protein